MLTWYLPLLSFILIAGFTPGPNNIIAMNIGFSYGFKKVIPHLLGVTVGFPVMLLLIGFIIKDLINSYEYIFTILKYISAIYLFYLSYKIATAPTTIEASSNQKLISFFESMAFQWINPKAWAGALATVTLYIPKSNYSYALIISALTSAVTIIFAIALWAYLGKRVKLYILRQNHIKIFNILMAIILIISVGVIVI